MRHVLSLAIAFVLAAPVGAAHAQQKQAPKQAPAQTAKPYNPVAVKLPAPLADPSFEAFRKQLGEIAAKKDRAALAKLVVAKGFFWDGEKGEQADPKKSGIDNLVAAIVLSGKQPVGWDMLQGYAQDPTGSPYPGKQGVICAPADPEFDEKALEDVAKATGSDPGDWAFSLADGVEVRAAARQNAPVTEKMGMHLIRIMPDDAPPPSQTEIPLVKVATPSGKIGFISADVLAPLGNDQVCYVKEADGWRIAGFVGLGPQ
jgi:hypothetical protein